MKLLPLAFFTAVVALAPAPSTAEDFQLPPEVTPAIRAACERDVRRLCIGENPTIAGVKSCVSAKFRQLGKSCQIQLSLAGFGQ
jgi:hypothetical protein